MTDCMQKWRVGQIRDGCRSEIYSSNSSSRLCPPSNCSSNNSCVKGPSKRKPTEGHWVERWCCGVGEPERSSFLETEGTSEGSTRWPSYRCTIGCWEVPWSTRKMYDSCQYAPPLTTLRGGYCARRQASVLNGCGFFSLSVKTSWGYWHWGSQSP